MAACWSLGTPLGALYFNLSWALVRRHPPRLRDFALPMSTRLIRIIHAGERHLLETQVPYQASVMNRFEPTNSTIGSRRGEASVVAHAPALP
jgi:hypothetical protein